ncbi:DnaJ domain-containing protein [Nonomuraea sp. NPDC052116]|uniref:DnaJ domain-containing protein n=1 Tax=Nonomuraea sp. NPDC052116 TaxID=3155665 RepID=UPI003416E9F5
MPTCAQPRTSPTAAARANARSHACHCCFTQKRSPAHPDDRAADERFKEVGEALDVLSDPSRRQAYDLTGRRQAEAAMKRSCQQLSR